MNIIKYYDKNLKKYFTFKYEYEGDYIYKLTNKDNELIMYVDLDNYEFLLNEIDITPEKEIIRKIIDFHMNDYDYMSYYYILERLI